LKRSKRITRLVIGIAVVAGVVTLASPGIAGAARSNGLWVSNTTAPVTGASTSCTTPGYSTIQSALDAATAGATIHVCAGIYPEQLQVTQAVSLVGVGSATVELPPTAANSTTTCDAAMEAGGYQPNQDLVSICTSATVSITDLTLNAAWPSGTCYDSLYGVLVGGGATLKLTSSNLTAAGASPINGCQGGVGIQVGSTRSTPSQVGTVVMSDDSISGYQKNGMTIDGVGSSGNLKHVTVTGAGATDQTAQNGIQVSRGATAKITLSTVSGNECNNSSCGADSQADSQATGVLFYNAGNGSSVTASTLSGNDIGVYASAVTAPTASQIAIKVDTFTNNRYESVLLDQGSTTLSKDTMSGGNVGIQAIQYNGQSFAAQGVAKSVTISGMSVAAAQVYSDLAPSGDLPVILSISKSQISGNPTGHSVLGSVQDNSTNSVVTLKSDT
jgi:hypothetical protein